MSEEYQPEEDAARSSGEEAICLACCTGDVAAIERLLRQEPTLVGAVGQVRPDHREYMMKFGADKGWSPLHLAAHYGYPAAVKALLDAGADPNVRSRNKIGNRPLGAAVAGGKLEIVRQLIEAGADVNATDVGGLTPLHLAANDSQHEIVEALLAAGADRGAKDKNGRTAGDLARAAGNTEGAAKLS